MAAIERPDALLQQRALAVKILSQLAEQVALTGKFEQAEQYCKEALQHEEGSVKVCMMYIGVCTEPPTSADVPGPMCR